MDRTVFSPVNVQSGDSIVFTFVITFQAAVDNEAVKVYIVM